MSKLRGVVKDGVIVLDPPVSLPDGQEVIVLYPTDHPLAPFAGCLSPKDARQMLQVIRSTRKSKKQPPRF